MASSTHFPDAELKCPCCGVNECTQQLVDALEELRAVVGPITVTSGYRCPNHNAKVGGEPNSQHCLGRAADVKVSRLTPAEVYRQAAKIPAFGGFGVAERFTHLDVRPVHARWCYGPDGKQCAWNSQIEVIA